MAYSTQRAVSDGTLEYLDLAIGYQSRADVKVFFNDLPAAPESWSWVGVTDKRIAFTDPVPDGVEVLVQRTTRLDRIINVFARGAKFNNTTMDLNFEQVLFLTQEAVEGSGLADIFNDLDLHGYRITNLGEATAPGDAVPRSQFDTLAADLTADLVAVQAAVEAVYDNFDDRYLGAKGTAPTLDNDGAALQVGALYWHTPGALMRAWSGSAWIDLATATASGIATTPAGNLSATNVQAALNELDSEKAIAGPLAGSGITGAAASGANSDITSLGALSTPISLLALRYYMAGGTMSTPGASATMSVAAAAAMDSTGTWLMQLAATSKTTAAWAVGGAVGGLDTGTIANNTKYYFYAIRRPDTGVVDLVFSLSAVSPNLPANYTQYRYIGMGLTNGSAQWVFFLQSGRTFVWGTPLLDAGGTASIGSSTNYTLRVPLGRRVMVTMNVAMANSTGGIGYYVHCPDVPTGAPSTSVEPLSTLVVDDNAGSGAQSTCLTNTSGQVAARANFADTIRFSTLAYTDTVGIDA